MRGRPYAEVVGDPIAHSKSPLIHNFWLSKLRIDAEYRARRVPAAELADYFARRRSDPAWRGCNLTMPHKTAVVPLLDRVEEPVELGSVNTVTCDGAALLGTSTDVAGIAESLAPFAGELRGAQAALIGAGGAARAVLLGLRRLGLGSVDILCRDSDAGERMAEEVGAGLTVAVHPLRVPLPPAKLVVNATPLGMTGQPPLTADLSRLPADAILFDLVYAPVRTELIAAAALRGLRTLDGLAMLIGQAAEAFGRFFRAPAPRGHDPELRRLLAS